jgi:hypothetical protein
MAVWYTRDNTGVGWTAVTAWSAAASKSPGNLIRQLAAPTVGNERVFIATQAAAANTGGAEPTWVITKGGKTTDNAVTWQECTGQPGINGDLTNCPNWNVVKNTAVALGFIIKNIANTFLFICTTAGTAGNAAEPTWTTAAGNTTTDNTITWTSIGAVGTFINWAAPFSRIGNAIAATWTNPGDIIYVAADHNETQASAITWNAGSAILPVAIHCVAVATIPPTVTTTGAAVNTSGNNGINISNANLSNLYLNGINITAGSGANNPQIDIGANSLNAQGLFEKCILKSGGTTGGRILIGIAGNPKITLFIFDSCSLVFSSTNADIAFGYGLIEFRNCGFAVTGTVPTNALFTPQNNMVEVLIKDSDLSNINNGVTTSLTRSGLITIRNSKINPAGVLVTGSYTNFGSTRLKLQNCDNGNTNYKNIYVQFAGILQHSTTIFRNGGANNGITAISWQIVTNTNAQQFGWFDTEDLIVWNDLIGSSRTATVNLTTATTLTNADIWLELEYLGNVAVPQATSDLSSKLAYFATATALANDITSIWTGGLGNNYKIVVNFTPQMKGPVRARLFITKPSVTINIDPVLVIN